MFRMHHDIGGDESAYGPIAGAGSKPVKDLLAWEQQCHSLFALLASKRILSTDQLRRAIEELTPQQYRTWSYYEKWTAAMVRLLMESRVITHDELQTVLFGPSTTTTNNKGADEEGEATSPRFEIGATVRVRRFLSSTEWKRPHIRTPGYIYGVAGTVERVCGRHGDPSFLAFGLEAPMVQLYRVRFRQCDIWPEQYNPGTTNSGDVVEVEVYEHWLEPTDRASGHSFEGATTSTTSQTLFDHTSGDGCDHAHAHHHGHHHHHVDDEGPHAHDARPTIESRAIQREGPPTPGKELFHALSRLLLNKEVVRAEEIRLMSERMDTALERLDGATLVVKAWTDPDFEARLLADAARAAHEWGIQTSNANAPTVLTVLKNTSSTHNLIVCTLCSCYPSGLLGIAPSWYKSREYRSRAVREPRIVLKEDFGVSLPEGTAIRVHDSTADHRYLVLPVRPEGTEDWTEDQLRTLITRDTMIGVALARVEPI